MTTDNLLLIEQFCTLYNIEDGFISSLHEFGLIELIVVEEHRYIAYEQLGEAEKMVRLYYDLGINLEGIDAIFHLQQKITKLQQELTQTKNKLKLFE